MTNRSVEKLCSLTCNEQFKGVFSADRIPSRLAPLSSFTVVANLAKSNSPAGHFVTISAQRNLVRYIDPYGFAPFQEDVKRFLRLCRRTVRSNRDQIQSVRSLHCGLYAILFANIGCGTIDFPAKFYVGGKGEAGLAANDKLCRDYLRRAFCS